MSLAGVRGHQLFCGHRLCRLVSAGIFGEETLVSLSWVTLSFTQSVIPIGAALFILAEIFSIPEAWRNAMAGIDYEKEMIDQAIEEASQS